MTTPSSPQCPFAAENTEAPPEGPWEELGAALSLDNDHVKAWVERVPPGESRPLHTHRKPWATVVLSGAKVRSVDARGETIAEGELPTHAILFNPAEAPLCHQMFNIGDTELVMVGIQLEHAPPTREAAEVETPEVEPSKVDKTEAAAA
ncbi:cupin domain-containing protein [Streptomyces triticirhizae]|uniref:Cupin domain-containing protein n=1 Tax=Streptomyces triticirhizae TaxID=2483353 RepID=A0A3M2LV84_9ACTN|nr:cupin domain-containing protein [Streptomyces triticirhizae]RMI41132.1 cupin domain-containing protein [Streptomyces triticirhizae]